MSARIAICGVQVPFDRGGAETLSGSLRDALRRRGHAAEIVTLPVSWRSRMATLKSAFAWRLVDLEEAVGERIDLVIATRFPSYLVRHPNKVVWLVHRDRQVQDLLGTPTADLADAAEDRRVVEMIRAMERRALGEARALHAASASAAERLWMNHGLRATALPPPLEPGDPSRGGEAGRRRVADVTWDAVVERLTATL